MAATKKLSLLKYTALLLGVIMGACVSDPWPEPDDMENDQSEGDRDYQNTQEDKNETGNDTDGSLGESESDTDMSATDTGMDTTDSEGQNYDADTEEDDGVDAGTTDVVQTTEVLLVDRVFVSTPTADGRMTLVGLPGAVAPGTTVYLESTVAPDTELVVGQDGAFAMRVPNAPEQALTLRAVNTGGESQQVRLVPGENTASFVDGIIGSGAGVTQVSATLVSIRGEGTHLKEGQLVVAANLSQSTGAVTQVICTEETCEFVLILSAAHGDAIDLFLVDSSESVENDAVRSGSIVEALVVP